MVGARIPAGNAEPIEFPAREAYGFRIYNIGRGIRIRLGNSPTRDLRNNFRLLLGVYDYEPQPVQFAARDGARRHVFPVFYNQHGYGDGIASRRRRSAAIHILWGIRDLGSGICFRTHPKRTRPQAEIGLVLWQ